MIVPFLGDRAAAEAMLERVGTLRRGPHDEVIVVDNGAEPTVPVNGHIARVIKAPAQRSSYYARNVGAEHAAAPWLLFLDADCRPRPTLLEDYFTEAIPARCGALAGRVLAACEQDHLVARYQRARGHLELALEQSDSARTFGVTANLLVRRDAWEAVGGFLEGIRSAGDTDFCFRLLDAGWSVVRNKAAIVEHFHRETVFGLARQMTRYGAGRAWLNRRHANVLTGPAKGRALVRAVLSAFGYALLGRFEEFRFRLLDVVAAGADAVGYWMSNAAAGGPRARGHDVVVVTDVFPGYSETFIAAEVAALRDGGVSVRVEAIGRPVHPDRRVARILPTAYREDDPRTRMLLDGAWLALRHPMRGISDVRGRRGWSIEEEVAPLRALAPAARRIARAREHHLHAHFATGAALDAMRIAALLGLPWSLTAHAYDIFQSPANLREKLRRASFVTTGCDYNVRYLRELVGPSGVDRVHQVVMGVDPQRFRRRRPYPGGRHVVAIGRLVEKKGFVHLLGAAAILSHQEPLERVTIAGEGPLRGQLTRRARELGVDGLLDLPGGLGHDEVRELLERADLLVMSCVVATDGDRDSMPVVVKEALAMEVPVVASNEVGLPELVRHEFGRLVTPGDERGLAEAIAELLELPVHERIEMGRAGRAFVLECCDLHGQARRLAALIDGVSDSSIAWRRGAGRRQVT